MVSQIKIYVIYIVVCPDFFEHSLDLFCGNLAGCRFKCLLDHSKYSKFIGVI